MKERLKRIHCWVEEYSVAERRVHVRYEWVYFLEVRLVHYCSRKWPMYGVYFTIVLPGRKMLLGSGQWEAVLH